MSERLKYLGRRQELEVEKKALEISIQGLIDNLRDALDPLAPVDELPAEEIAAWSRDLAERRERYRSVLADLKRLADLLGR
jgi:hypothetical protein